MNEVLKTIKSRRSVRSYKGEQIKQEELDLIIEAGIYAPTGHNDQPWHFTVIQNKALIQEINTLSKEIMANSDLDWMKAVAANPEYDITYGAPTLVIVSGRINGVTPQTDCDAAIQNMLLAAESLNIGSVWLGLVRFYLNIEGKSQELGIPDGYQPLYGVALGYKKNDKEQVAPKRNYDVVNYIR